MAHLIDKDILVEELEKRTDELYDLLPDASKAENGIITISEACNTGKYTALESFRKYIDTLKVKEVDLEKEYEEFVVDDPILNVFIQNDVMGMKVAKHFFELGLKAKDK